MLEEVYKYWLQRLFWKAFTLYKTLADVPVVGLLFLLPYHQSKRLL